jgi:HlyD family secretion protein
MTSRVTFSILALLCLSGAAAAQVGQPLSLATAQSVTPASVTATGRLQTVISARVSPRVSGQLAELGTDNQGRRLDAGMLVTKSQVLFKLDDTTYSNHLAAAQAALASATAGLEFLKDKTRPEVLEQLRQAVAELDLRVGNQQKDFERYQRLVQVDKTLPEKRLEDAALELDRFKSQRKAAAARLEEAENGATRTAIAVVEARVNEAQVAVKAAQDDVRDTVVLAPFDGMITRRMKSPGDYIAATPPTEVMEIVSLRELEVEFRLPEMYLGRIEEGKTPVKLTSAALQTTLDTTVTRIIREIDPVQGTFACRTAVTADQRGALTPGAFVTAQIRLGKNAADVVVPQRAVVRDGTAAAVFVAADGKMKRVLVEVGDRLTEGVLIKAGLQGGEKVLVGPAELLKDGDRLPEYLVSGGGAAAASRP